MSAPSPAPRAADASSPPVLGKLSPTEFERLIAPHLGARRPEVLVGPRAGHDCAIVRIGAGRVMAITTDPISLIPCLGAAASARLACHLGASDLWTSGIPPAYVAVNFHLPPDLPEATLAEYARAMGEEWASLGVAVVTGHTGRYPAGRGGADPAASLLGSATIIGVGDEGRYLTPGMAAPGDRVIVTKGCAIEATAIAAHLIPARMKRALAEAGLAEREAAAALDRARAMLAQVSVVADCRAALRVGVRDRGVSALHDATEGGVLGGLIELAKASGRDLRVEQARIPCGVEARAACAALGGIDPWWALSEGALIAAVRPAQAKAVLAAFTAEGIVTADVGEAMEGNGRLWLTEPGGTVRTLDEPEPDPYWAAYGRAVLTGDE